MLGCRTQHAWRCRRPGTKEAERLALAYRISDDKAPEIKDMRAATDYPKQLKATMLEETDVNAYALLVS